MKRGKRALDGLDQDIRDHIQRETEDNIDRGLSPEDARRRALLMFGNVALVKEDTRAVWVARWLEQLLQDTRYALRTMRRNSGFSAVMLLTLALGVGMNTAVFSVTSAVLLRPLPYAEPERLVSVWEVRTARGERLNVSPADFADYRVQNTSFADMAGYALVGKNLTESGPPERLWVQQVTPNLLSVLGARPATGRGFRDEEDQPGKDHVVILSRETWAQRFGADPNIVGRVLRLNGEPYEIVGACRKGSRLQLNSILTNRFRF